MSFNSRSCNGLDSIFCRVATALTLTALFSPLAATADGGVHFVDRTAELGVDFEHVAPPREAILEALKTQPFRVPDDLGTVPHKPHGAPGVAIFDFDRDGDLDVYVTNSVGGANALYSNQLRESGAVGFVDVAAVAGVDAVDHDSTGVCYGDVDNDGDQDLMVLGAIMPNRLYENRGDGTFVDVTAQAGVGGGDLSTSSCTMGDVDGDGLLDVVVANTHTDWNDLLGIVMPFTFNEHNQLFVNQGGNVFVDMSAVSGIETLAALPPGAASLTWALALVDYDLDGDVDLFTFDDQGGVPHPFQGGVNYGIIHLHENDGSGFFVDRTIEAGLVLPGNWMGVAFGDFDCDGNLDFFATNAGDYPPVDGPPMFPLGTVASRWFLGQDDGTFTVPAIGPELVGTVFGWGAAVFDYDNDGDQDVAYHGAIDVGFVVDASNPGTLLRNEGCSASFVYDDQAFAMGADHTRRIGQGLAAGDLDENGLMDLVTVSNADLAESAPLILRTLSAIGSPFDATAFFALGMVPIDPADPTLLIGSGLELEDGSLAIELAEAVGEVGGSAKVELVGSVGLTSRGRVNRDGIGAVVRFTTPGGKSQMVPVVGGDSYASQSSLAVHLGFGDERRGTVEVLWPGGTRNVLRGVRPGERIVFPEIPCDVATAGDDRDAYVACVRESLIELLAAKVIDRRARARFLVSALAPVR